MTYINLFFSYLSRYSYRFFIITLTVFGLPLAIEETPTAIASPTVIAAFGDSLSSGYLLPSEKGFPTVLQNALEKDNLSVTVVNAAIPGETSSDALLRVNWMLKTIQPDLVIVEFGANDMFRGLPTDMIYNNLSTVIQSIKKTGAKVLLAGMLASPNAGREYQTNFMEIYPSLAKKHHVVLFPFFLKDVATVKTLNLEDGIHPNADGVRVIVNNILPFVKKTLSQ